MPGLLLHSPADIACQVLIDLGLASDPGPPPAGAWPARVDIEPDSPDENITLKTTTGRSHGSEQIGGQIVRSLGVQIVFRSKRSNQGTVKAQAVQNALETGVVGMQITLPADSGSGVAAASYVVDCFDDVGDVLPLGLGAGSNRFVHTLNVTMSVRPL